MFKEMNHNEMLDVSGGGFWYNVATGAAGGAITGAQAGSVVPGGGTIAGGLAGAVIGAGMGALSYAIGEMTP